MKFTLDEYRNLGSDATRIRDFYRTEEPEVILQVLITPVAAGLDDDGLSLLKSLMEDSITLEQHIAFAGWNSSADQQNPDGTDQTVDPVKAEIYRRLAYRGALYEGAGR